MIDAVKHMILNNRRIKVANDLNIIYDFINFLEVYPSQIQRQLMDIYKDNLLKIFQKLLTRFEDKEDLFLDGIKTVYKRMDPLLVSKKV